MMIYLKQITLNDFLSHEKTTLSFTEHEQVLIDGASGAGKSTIFDAILWAIYGQGRADNRALVRKGTKKGSVSLELVRRTNGVEDGETVIITRTATAAGKHNLEVAFQKSDGSREAHPLTGVRPLQEWIDKELIGASYLLFINSVAYVQGNSESFVSQTAPKRKELLLEIVKAEDYSKHYEKARQALSDLTAEEQKVLGQVTELDTQLGSLQARIGFKEDITKHLEALKATLKDIAPKKAVLEEQKAKFAALSQAVTLMDTVYRTSVLDAEKAEKVLKEKVEEVAGRDKLLTSLRGREQLSTDIDDLRGKLAAARIDLTMQAENEAKRGAWNARKPIVRNRETELASYTGRIEKILLEPVCASGVDCPYSGDHTKQVEDLRTSIKSALAMTKKEETDLATWALEAATLPAPTSLGHIVAEITTMEATVRTKEAELSQLDSVQKEVERLLELEKQLPALMTEMQEKWTAVDAAKKNKEEAAKSTDPDEINKAWNELQAVLNEERDATEKVTRATASLENIAMDEKTAAEIALRASFLRSKSLKDIKDKVRKIGLVKDAFGSKGIETLVIDYLLPKLEDRINEVLSKLSDFRVRLDTQRKSADGESVVEGLFITILNELAEEMPFEAYSGGEKLKISVSISEALAILQKVGFRLFDETFLGLDENSTEAFSEVLVGLQQSFGQVFCISHLLQIKELFDKKITITKKNGVSTVATV
jgi:DNA repair exonuclease SbcCD ATPase subunit